MLEVFIFAGVIFIVRRSLMPILLQRTAISSMLPRDLFALQDKLSCLVASYQNQFPSRPSCGINVSLPSLYSHGLSPRTGTGAIGINSGRQPVLAGR